MAATSPATRLVTAAAREVLRPLGLKQRGRSRIWIDDHGWWLGVVEFQPSSWSQGSYLNVGAMWLWQDADRLEFHQGGREAGHEPYEDEAQFAPLATALARAAAVEVAGYRARFATLAATAQDLAARPARRGNLWDNYHAGIAAGLVGDVPTARDRLARAAQQLSGTDIPWMVEAHRTARQLRETAEDTGALRRWAAERTASGRQKLKLGPPPAGLPEELRGP
ncbi:hypothetical protein [Kitasatospora cheerisanensis]|nr:hypothetical protein [Kitasatospora cheerisanensis]